MLQLLAATERTGQLEVRADDEQRRGFFGMSAGRLVSARYEDEEGILALGAIFAIDRGDFEFLPSERIEHEDLSGDLEDLLERGTAERERQREIRGVIRESGTRFRLSERAAAGERITLSAEQWRALLLVNGERSVRDITAELGITTLAGQQLLADLVRAGLVDAVEPAPEAPGEVARPYRRFPPMSPIPPTDAGEQVVLRGDLGDLPLETVIQLLAETAKTGRLEVRAGRDSSTLGVAEGRLVSAVCGEEEGEMGLGAAFMARDGRFEFVPMSAAPAPNLGGDLDPLLDRAVAIRDQIVAVRALIPDDRSRFTLSERATGRSEIVLTPEQWRVLLGVNGQLDVDGIADQLRMRRLPAMIALADLVRGGYVDVIAPADLTWPYVERRRTPWPPTPPPPPVQPEPERAAEPERVAAEPRVAAPEPQAEASEPAAEAETGPAEEPLAQTPLDVEPEQQDDRLAALSGLFGTPEPAPPPPAWEPPPVPEPTAEEAAATATAEAFTWRPAEEEAPPPEAPPAEEIDPRLAAFAAPPPEPAVETREPAAPAEEPGVEVVTPSFEWPRREPEAPQPPPPPPVEPPKKRGLFGGLFGGGAGPAAPAAPAGPRALTGPGQLARLLNELLDLYNSGRYGKRRLEDRMPSLLMRADEQADPIDRPLPVADDRLDVGQIDRGALPERQVLPYLAVVSRQIFEDAERAYGRDKARRGFRDARDRVFGRDIALLQTPEVAPHLPKV